MRTSCTDLISSLTAYEPSADVEMVKKAYDYAVKYHGSQKRESGDPYYQHPIEVAKIIINMRLDSNSVIAAILHDTIEDTSLTSKKIEKEFNHEIAKLVNGVTKLTKIEFQPDYVRQAENFRKLLLAMSDDLRVLIIKLADRLHNMRTIEYVSPEKRNRISIETMEIYAPLAERMGMQEIKLELHDIAFRILHPAIHSSIVTRLNEMSENEQNLIDNIMEQLKKVLDTLEIKFEISGRRKTPFSIWMKMKHKNVDFDKLADIMAFRVVVDDLLECYKVLGIMHSSFKMIPEQFQDFISTPKNNGYQSLHTVIIGPEKQRIEVQIRTKQMHQVAEWGLAAHWSYKQNQKLSRNDPNNFQYKWIRDLLDILEHTNDPQEFLRNTKMAMHYDQVFCFTPKGELIALPTKATAVDFAYMVHSDVGNKCVGAIINGKIAPLKTFLKNGDQIEIITSTTGKPSLAWEEFVTTGRARSEIKKFIRNQRRDEFIIIGKNIFEKELKLFGIDFKSINLKSLLKKFARHSVEELYLALGENALTKNQIFDSIFAQSKRISTSKENDISDLHITKVKKNKTISESSKYESDIIGLVSGMVSNFAGCCHPVFGDKIIGLVHTARGVTIHRVNCTNIINLEDEPGQLVELEWNMNKKEIPCISRLKIVVTNEVGSLAFVTSIMAQSGVAITNFRITNKNQDVFEMIVDVDVGNQKQLDSIIASLKSGKHVTLVSRSRS